MPGVSWAHVVSAMLFCVLAACSPTLPRLPAPQPSDAIRDGRLRFATFNAWLLPGASDDLSTRMCRMPRAFSRLDIDVICLQEVWLTCYQIEFERSLRRQFPHAVRSPGGLMVLSKFPILHRKFHSFPTQGLLPTEWIAGKGALEVVLDAPGGRIRVVTTHMALDVSDEQRGRRRQLRRLGRLVYEWADLPLILAGDFNVPPTWNDRLTHDYRLIQSWGVLDTSPPRRRADGTYEVHRATRVGWPPHARPRILFQWSIDYILYRNVSHDRRPLSSCGLTLHLTEPHEALSDHHLLVAEFQR